MRQLNKDIICLYFYAWWDGCDKYKNKFIKVCRAHMLRHQFVDCETPQGVRESIRRQVRMCPTVIVLERGQEIYRCKGNNVFSELDAFFSDCQLPTPKGAGLQRP